MRQSDQAGQTARILRLDHARQIERACTQQHGDNDKTDRDFVTHHLRRRAKRREERIFRVRRPAGHDDAVDRQRGNREDVEHTDVDVRDYPAEIRGDHGPCRERQHAAHQGRQQEHALVGAGWNDRLLQHEFQKVSKRLEQAPGADHVGTAPDLHRRPDLAIGEQNVGDRDQQHDEQQHAFRDHDDQRPEEAGPERAFKKFSHQVTLTPLPSASCRRPGGSIPP
ncbi:hypothetical protein GALL_517980 [mine drainage metagenome]|uniref:Uncharacterized protein n=1 Tax=mine drainage metagenome TaxID=410659 RepID=A0A1J5PST5_9ZZZZ